MSAESAEDYETILHLEDWTHPADADDCAILELCSGATLDVGCGPGRLAERLAERGHVVLGVDMSHAAVAQAVERGASVLRRDVFSAMPGEGRWDTALLADGNLGIGGDPVALLRRMRELLDPRGQVVAELAAPGTGLRAGWATLRWEERVTARFRWAEVGVDAIEDVAGQAGLGVVAVHRLGDRWCAVLAALP